MSTTTKRALATSLKNLMEKKTLDKITVKEIVDGCGLNRQTFYYHFQDTYDLLKWLYWDDTAAIRERIYDPSFELAKYNLILEYILSNKSFVINTCRSFSQNYLIGTLMGWIEPIILEIAKQYLGNSPRLNEDIDFIALLYSHALVGLIFDWINKNLDIDFLSEFNKFTEVFIGHLKRLKSTPVSA